MVAGFRDFSGEQARYIKMDTAFIIRFHYREHDPDFDWRFSYFRSAVLPRILAQTEQDFEIAIWCNPWHHALFKSLSEKIRVFGVRPEAEGLIRSEDRARADKFHIDFTYWKDVVDLPAYDLQIGLDSDDLIHECYVARILEEVKVHGDGSLHICFQPMIFNLANRTYYDFKFRYGPEKGSAFFALLQKDKSKFLFAYEHSHLKLPSLFDRSVTIPEGYCWFTAHDRNASSRLPADSVPIPNP